MAQVNHDALPVHLLYHLLAKTAHSMVGGTALGTVADIVVAIVAQGDIHHATLGKIPHVGQLVVQGQTVLYAQHD